MLKKILLLAWALVVSLACTNTSYSRSDEIEITNDLVHLILGQFAHHGEAFYRHELERNEEILLSKPDDYTARNDLAAAYLKLGDWPKAQQEFERNEDLYPGRYKTASNLGVLNKKMGKYEEAGQWIKRALEIKPGGHMGLGDYYLRMIDWRAKNAAHKKQYDRERTKAKENFLGLSYDLEPQELIKHEVVNREYLITLIKNDFEFSDVYLVLGDLLFHEGEYQLALRAYLRAQDLGHPRYDLLQDRLMAIKTIWKQENKSGYVLERRFNNYQMKEEFKNAKTWLASFQQVEAELLAQDKPATFAAIKHELGRQNITRPKVIEALYYKGSESSIGDPASFIIMGCIAIGFIILVILGMRGLKRLCKRQEVQN